MCLLRVACPLVEDAGLEVNLQAIRDFTLVIQSVRGRDAQEPARLCLSIEGPHDLMETRGISGE